MHERCLNRRVVHSRADGVYRSLSAEIGKRGISRAACFGEVIVGVMEEEDVELVDPNAGATLCDRARYPVVAEVPQRPGGRDVFVEGLAVVVLRFVTRRAFAQK